MGRGHLLDSQSDERLAELAIAGDTAAFEAIVNRYRKPLLRYCDRFLPSAGAEDAVQQTFLFAFRSLPAADARRMHLRPWLYRIAHNVAHDALRKNDSSAAPLDEDIPSGDAPDRIVEIRDQLARTLHAIDELPARQRLAIVRSGVDGRGSEAIGAELGISAAAARQLVRRARVAVRAAA
jgi:RNA polymerase sigma factor (sigma-70 family)